MDDKTTSSRNEKYANILETRLSYLQNRLENIEDKLDDPKSADWEEHATESEGDEVMEELGLAGQVEMQAIKAALARVENGSFGICVTCGEPISEERLATVPHTPFCKDCAPR